MLKVARLRHRYSACFQIQLKLNTVCQDKQGNGNFDYFNM